jgi:UDP-2,3-diacylglucosamine pyrophosphatase LpxH
MIHGHTHRPAIHYLNLEQGFKHRHFVLSDWHAQGNALYYYPDQSCRLVFFK